LDLEFDGGWADDFSGHDRVEAEVGQGASNQTTSEDDEDRGLLQMLLSVRHPLEELERLVLENVNSLVVGSEVVNLFAKNAGPKVLADEFHQVQFVLELGVFSGQFFNESVSGVVAEELLVG